MPIETRLIHTSSTDYYDDEAQAKEDLGDAYDPADFEKWVRVRDVESTLEFYGEYAGNCESCAIEYGYFGDPIDYEWNDDGERARELLNKLKG